MTEKFRSFNFLSVFKEILFLTLIVPLLKLVFMIMRISELNFTVNKLKTTDFYDCMILGLEHLGKISNIVKHERIMPHTDIVSLFWFSACFFTL